MEEDKLGPTIASLTPEELLELEDRLSHVFYGVDRYSIHDIRHNPSAVMKYCKSILMAMLRGLSPDRQQRVFAILAEQFTNQEESFETLFRKHEAALEQYYVTQYIRATASSNKGQGMADTGG